MTNVIDLSQMAPPDVVEELEYESILSAMLSELRSRDPEFNALVESDPAYKILEVCAYREMLVRQRVNDAARSVMLAYASGADLEQLAALYGVTRLVVEPGDPDADPPVLPTYEPDDRLRRRVSMAPTGWSCAGSAGSYRYHALSADAEVKDVAVSSPAPGEVRVTVLSDGGDGTAGPELLGIVDAALSADTVRPLCDAVVVQSASIIPYAVSAGLYLYYGPDEDMVRQASEAAVVAYVHDQHRLGRDVTLSGLYAALHQPGVQRVVLLSPAENVVCGPYEAAWCESVTVTAEGRDE